MFRQIKKIIFFIIIFYCTLSIVRSASAIITLWKKQEVLVRAQKELSLAQKQHDYLTRQLTIVEDSSFVEKEARNKLFMAKPGENTVIIPSGLIASKQKQKASTLTSQSNWEQWFSLFL